MAAAFIQDPVLNDVDDDGACAALAFYRMRAFCACTDASPPTDGMPPLVDNPYPSMTFTFSAEMTPITYSTDPTRFEIVPDLQNEQNEQVATYSPPASPTLGPTRVPHSKKRDASYIPRPPNAFILFRSHFIRAQHIPGKIEGNHSALSKIIGMCPCNLLWLLLFVYSLQSYPGKYWKALPREDKEVWEAKAIVAQAEHRKKYPDWRFRPGANALAKVKDGPRKRTNRKGRGEAEKEERSREKRCAKIADLLVAGKTGADLQVAIEEYDCENGGAKPNIKKEGSGGVLLVQFAENMTPSVEPRETTPPPVPQVAAPQPPAHAAPADRDSAPRKQSRSLSPEAAHDICFKTPLTAMFKRSSSAPAPCTRAGPETGGFLMPTPAHEDINSVNSSASAGTFTAPFLIDAHEGKPRVSSDITGTSDANTRLLDVKQHASVQSLPETTSPVANFSPPGGNVSQSLWTQVSKVLINVLLDFSQADDIFTVF